ncbi:MAG: glucosamine-6-phosphate deaminase [Candidatus Omnitrophica bacterium]|nr:Glucosamine-6-phosphate deaminase [bacterium]NUN96511.1 glucosamine-6-phosphate deaminase [Candidatus Omnitrophota bacterium]
MKNPIIETAPEFRQLERLPVQIIGDYEALAVQVAAEVARSIREKSARGEKTVLGLVTGNTAVGIYREWIRMHREEGFDFSSVVVFNLGEYYPIGHDSLQSTSRFLRENLLDSINIPEDQLHFLRGDLPRAQMDRHCKDYERAIRAEGGIDIQLIEAGRLGHVGFNEPGTLPTTRTRVVAIDEVTRKEAAADFFSEENVPEFAVTMGMGTLLEAKRVLLIAIGEGKAGLIRRIVEEEATPSVTASCFQGHPDVQVFADLGAAGMLTRVRKPWTLGEVNWTPDLEYRAVIQLSEETGTALSKLENTDYNRNRLTSLLRSSGAPDVINARVAHKLMSRIYHTPDFFERKRVLIFSPHPDDDVICMGGTMQKLTERKNRVDVAYMSSGNLAVFDEDALRHLEFILRIGDSLGARDAKSSRAISSLMEFLHTKRIGEIDNPGVQDVKRVIRESEAIAAIETLGIGREHAHFLNLPFYQTGKVKKDPIDDEDVSIVLECLRKLKPDHIFVAGDMTDPHGTHRMCKQAIDQALQRLKPPQRPKVWLYRGAWQEWDIHEVDVFVPLSKAEAKKKTLSIFKHESQKDRAVFPGPYDDREFWQRAEDRNKGTAKALDRLGLQEYFALEAFVFEEIP